MHLDRIAPATATTRLGEVALAEGSERYASMFTHHPHAAWSLDARGYVTDANEPALVMTGLSLEELRQVHFAEVIHPDDLSAIRAGVEAAFAGSPQVFEGRVVTTDGEVRDMRVTAIPVVVGGEVVGVHGVSEDVTEAKRLLRELEEANAAKTLFLATVSHEVRTPLAALVGASELLLGCDLADEARHFAHIVHRSGDRLMRVAEDILEFTGLEAHQTVLRREPVDLREIIDDIASWFVPYAQTRGLAISFTVEDSVPETCLGDARRISQVVTNLVQNALTFTERGSVDVRGCGRPVQDDPGAGMWVEFEVRDTGIGIAEDDADSLYLPFMQADPMTSRHGQGVGLGLAICRKIVDLMGGRLTLESALGEGSTFTFGAPLAVAEESSFRR